MKRSVLLGAVLLLVGNCLAQSVRMDDSDWWSLLRVDTPLPPPSKIETPSANFEILGITLFDDNLFRTVTRRLGKATEVERGDAATGRNQLCYTSADGTIHLVFEQGEVESVLYVFSGGPTWEGSNLCNPTQAVSNSIATRSGLRMGMTVAQVRRILGVPSVQKADRILYSRQTKKRTPPKLLEEIRKHDPNHYSDKEFHEQFDFYDETVYIECRFTNSKLTYLAISQSGTT